MDDGLLIGLLLVGVFIVSFWLGAILACIAERICKFINSCGPGCCCANGRNNKVEPATPPPTPQEDTQQQATTSFTAAANVATQELGTDNACYLNTPSLQRKATAGTDESRREGPTRIVLPPPPTSEPPPLPSKARPKVSRNHPITGIISQPQSSPPISQPGIELKTLEPTSSSSSTANVSQPKPVDLADTMDDSWRYGNASRRHHLEKDNAFKQPPAKPPKLRNISSSSYNNVVQHQSNKTEMPTYDDLVHPEPKKRWSLRSCEDYNTNKQHGSSEETIRNNSSCSSGSYNGLVNRTYDLSQGYAFQLHEANELKIKHDRRETRK